MRGAGGSRWGHYGSPVLIFPTAGGDSRGVERHGLIAALAPLIDAGRIKVYSVDSVAGRHWIDEEPLAALQLACSEPVRHVHLPRAGAADPPGLRVERHRARGFRSLDRRLQRGGDALPAPRRASTRDRDERHLRSVALRATATGTTTSTTPRRCTTCRGWLRTGRSRYCGAAW